MIVFAHGLEGSPHGTKVTALRDAGFVVNAPDFTGQSLAERVAKLSKVTEKGPGVLGGSSYGGLVAAIVAARHPGRFTGLLLCAPAFSLSEPPAENPETIRAPEGLPTIVIHGKQDDVVPIEVSRRYLERSGPHVRLWEVEDGHRLANSLDLLIRAARELHLPSGSG